MSSGFVKKACIVAATGTLALAACGGDDSKSAASTAPAATTATTGGAATTAAAGGAAATAAAVGSGKPFKVMVTGDFTSVIAYTVAEVVPAVKGAMKGVAGATILTCDSKGDANAATACQRKAVEEGASVVIAGFGYGAQDQSILEKAGIPALGVVSEKASDSFAIASSQGGYIGIGVALGNAGCKKLGILELDGTDQLGDAITKGFKTTGGTEAARAGIAANAPDLAPAIAKLLGAGAECIALSVTPPQLIQAATAVSQTGKKPLLAGTASIFFPQIIKAMGPLAEGVIMTDNVASAQEDTPGTRAVKAAMAEFDSKAPLTNMAIYGWIAGRMVAEAAAHVSGDVTKESLMAALNNLKDIDTQGLSHPITTTELKNPAFKRFINPWVATFTIKSGVPTKTSDFVNVGSIIDAP